MTEDSLNSALLNTRNDTARVKLLLALAHLYRAGDVTRQFVYGNDALTNALRAGWQRGEMLAEEVLGECYIKVQAFPEAIRHFDQSIGLARKQGDALIERIALQYEVHCYSNLPDTPAAAAIQKQLLQRYLTTTDNHLAQFRQMATYAQLLSETGHYLSGLDWMRRATAIAEDNFTGALRSDLVAECLNNSVPLFLRAGQPDGALIALRRAIILAADTANTGLAADITGSFCSVFAALGRNDSAIWYGKKVYGMGKELRHIGLQQGYAAILSNLYANTDQPAVALRYRIVSDSLAALANVDRQTLKQAQAIARINMEQQAAMQARERQ